jgi:hypothetical protein
MVRRRRRRRRRRRQGICWRGGVRRDLGDSARRGCRSRGIEQGDVSAAVTDMHLDAAVTDMHLELSDFTKVKLKFTKCSLVT